MVVYGGFYNVLLLLLWLSLLLLCFVFRVVGVSFLLFGVVPLLFLLFFRICSRWHCLVLAFGIVLFLLVRCCFWRWYLLSCFMVVVAVVVVAVDVLLWLLSVCR